MTSIEDKSLTEVFCYIERQALLYGDVEYTFDYDDYLIVKTPATGDSRAFKIDTENILTQLIEEYLSNE